MSYNQKKKKKRAICTVLFYLQLLQCSPATLAPPQKKNIKIKDVPDAKIFIALFLKYTTRTMVYLIIFNLTLTVSLNTGRKSY